MNNTELTPSMATRPTVMLPKPPTSRIAFTLVEMLIAMAVTLLLMAALAKGFAFIGANVRDSRVQVALSDEARDVTLRLRDELQRCTVSLSPNLTAPDQSGYFLYYEGPLTDATSTLFRLTTDANGDQAAIDSRYGDSDDYLAFTAVAKGDDWFTGVVPRFVLDQKTAELAGASYTPGADALDPIVIRSKYAEIVYFASPEYLPASLPATPAYVDVDGDTDLGSGGAIQNGFPDRIKLHRRVLLIRPDLNLNSGSIQSRLLGGVEFLLADDWPTASTTTNQTIRTAANAGDGWLYGMAGVHQQCDLSLRRVLDSDGEPTQAIAANSLADLTLPHNRFAHVRIPGTVLGVGGTERSMPVLALGASLTIFEAQSVAPVVDMAPPLTPSAGPIVTPAGLSGFIRPEFVLGNDLSHLDSTADLWGIERRGDDVLVNNVLAFDLRVYDQQSASITSSTTGLVVSPSDVGYREVLREVHTRRSGSMPEPIENIRVVRGGYVDLGYAVLAGGSIRGWQARRLNRLSTADDPFVDATITPLDRFLVTPFSGLASFAAGSTGRNCFPPSFYRSGKIVVDASDDIRLFQPAFDTYTTAYERDGFQQTDGSVSGAGTRWISGVPTSGFDEGADGLEQNLVFGFDNLNERETLPPYIATPDSIRVTIRLENPSNRQVHQASVVHRASR